MTTHQPLGGIGPLAVDRKGVGTGRHRLGDHNGRRYDDYTRLVQFDPTALTPTNPLPDP